MSTRPASEFHAGETFTLPWPGTPMRSNLRVSEFNAQTGTITLETLRECAALMVEASDNHRPMYGLMTARNWYQIVIGHVSPRAARKAANRRRRRAARMLRGWSP